MLGNKAQEVMKTLTKEHLFQQTKACIQDALNYPDEAAPFTLYITIGEFKQMKGFYGSRLFLRELMNAYIGRFARHAMFMHNLSIKEAFSILTENYKVEEEAITELQKYYIEKWGVVPEDKVKEYDALAASWQAQAAENLLGKDPNAA